MRRARQPQPLPPPPVAIRRALEEGWRSFKASPWPLVQFSVVVGCGNLACQLGIRWSDALLLDPFGQPDPLVVAIQLLAWLGYGISNLWLMVGLLEGASQTLAGRVPRLRQLLAIPAAALLRAGGTLAVVLLVLALISRLAQASAWLLALLQPGLVGLPLLAGLAAMVYVSADQILSLPICVLEGVHPLEAFRRSRALTDPHWLQALGLTLLLGLLVLAGFLLLVVGLLAALPLAACTLVAAYRQLQPLPAQALRKLD